MQTSNCPMPIVSTCLGNICNYSISKRHRQACDAYNRWRDILLAFYVRHTEISIARWLSSEYKCLAHNELVNVLLTHSVPYKIAWNRREEKKNRLSTRITLALYADSHLKCSYFHTPSSCDSGIVRIASIFDGSFFISCWMYCWTAKVLSISSNGSSGHRQKS